MHVQCDARPTIRPTFPAAGNHCPLVGIKLYCLVTVPSARAESGTAVGVVLLNNACNYTVIFYLE